MRLFTGLPVPADVADQLLRLARRIPISNLRWTPPENLHVTLYFLGEVAEPSLPELRLALDRVVSAGFGFSVSGLGSFARGGVLFATVDKSAALERLQAAVAEQVSTFAARPDPNSPPRGLYHPHITLARTRKRIRIDPAKLPRLATPLQLRAEVVNLYQSRLGAGSACYEVIHCRSLSAKLPGRDAS